MSGIEYLYHWGIIIDFDSDLAATEFKRDLSWTSKTLATQIIRADLQMQFSVPQIEYPIGGSTKNGSHVYFLLQVFCVILLFHQIVLLSDINIVLMSQ